MTIISSLPAMAPRSCFIMSLLISSTLLTFARSSSSMRSPTSLMSFSTATTRFAAFAAWTVRAPSPGPISRTRSMSEMAARFTIISAALGSERKFCPSSFLAMSCCCFNNVPGLVIGPLAAQVFFQFSFLASFKSTLHSLGPFPHFLVAFSIFKF